MCSSSVPCNVRHRSVNVIDVSEGALDVVMVREPSIPSPMDCELAKIWQALVPTLVHETTTVSPLDTTLG